MKTEADSTILSSALRLWSALSHGLGAVLGLVGTTILLCRAWFTGNPKEFIIFLIYGLSVVSLYTASTLYHSVSGKESLRRGLRKLDHCCIYFLIAGSYTPICILALASPLGYGLLGGIWLCAMVGIILTTIRLSIPHWVSSLIYLAMGWMALFAFVPLTQALSSVAMTLLLVGAYFYTMGGILYALKLPGRHNPHFGCHEYFHLFILMGSIFHFIMMFFI